MSTEERPDSLASQAAAWVPPWERQTRPPDPAYAAASPDIDLSDDLPDPADAGDPGIAADLADPVDSSDRADRADRADQADRAEPAADAADDRPDVVPPELAPIPGDAPGPATVDAPQQLPGEEEPHPTDVGLLPDLPVPDAVETAEQVDGGGAGAPVDAPASMDGDDAGEVFDAAADDDVNDDDVSDDDVSDDDVRDDDELDLPIAEAATAARDVPAAGDVPLSGDGFSDAEPGTASGPAIPAQGRGRGDKGPAAAGAGRRTPQETETAGELPPIDDAELRAALEAILLVVDEPVGELQLAQVMEQPVERVAAMLQDISARYTAAGHGFDLRRAAGGWRLYTRGEYAPYVERFVLDGQSVRLTQAALETLAVVAYKQPVTRSRISAIRGVNCDGVMRTLVTRGLIAECGTEPETGAFLYRTTALFLEKLGLDSTDQLPPLAPFLPDDLEEVIDAQR